MKKESNLKTERKNVSSNDYVFMSNGGKSV